MKTLALVVSLFAIGNVATFGQELYMPRNVKPAYAAGFRSMDGKPGPKYFQNKSVHDIRLSVAPPSRRIDGSEDITYTNNSPIPLAVLYLRFELNIHTPGAMREKPYDEKSLVSGGVLIDEYAENGKIKPWQPLIPLQTITFNIVQLDTPLQPGATVKLSFKWHYTLADHGGTDREGAVDPTTYYLAYFYPRVAVLDDVNNWDGLHHMGSHEFYNDFNDYNVAVTVPKNFVVWGTGDLTNIDEVLQPKFAQRLKSSFTSDAVSSIASSAEMRSNTVTAQNPTNTWKWKATNVSDTMYGLSDHYNWDAGSVVVDKKTGRRASAQAAYDDESVNFKQMVRYIKTALDHASNDLPGVPYPYPKLTVFRGFADMEGPMMANDSHQTEAAIPPNLKGTVTPADMQPFIAAHEILHTYFPFYMGIHERRYAFMEEGWTTAFEYPFNVKIMGKAKADAIYKQFRVNNWITSADPGADIPIMTPEDSMFGDNFGNNKYGKAAIGYLALRDLLGEAEFKRALHVFMDRWNGKHPIPWDMFNSFNNATGKDLNWFWNSWFFQPNYIDHAIKGVKRGTGGTEVTLKNIGGMPAPVDVIVTFEDESKETFHQGPDIWRSNMKEAVVRINQSKGVKSIVLDGGIWMDANPADNKWGE